MDSDCGALGPDNFFALHLQSALDRGSVTPSLWARAAKNLFRVQMRLGMFDPDEKQPFRSYNASMVDSPRHRLLALEAARQGLVLALNKNDTLPLPKAVQTLAVIGPNADATTTLQSNYHGTAPLLVSPFQGLKHYVPEAVLVQGVDIAGNDTQGVPAAVTAAAQADAVVLVLGLDQSQEREGHDRTSIALSPGQQTLLKAVSAVRPVVIVVISGGPIDLNEAKANPNVRAIIIAGYPGQSGGQVTLCQSVLTSQSISTI